MSTFRVALPAGTPGEVLGVLDAEGLGVLRARIAARLGDPGPFAIRRQLGERVMFGDVTPTEAAEGTPLSPDLADAVLVEAAVHLSRPDAGFAALFAGRPPGPLARSIPVDDARFSSLRFPRAAPPPPPQLGTATTWSAGTIGDAAAATIRAAIEVPGGVALGSDYGLTIWKNGTFTPFPWPAGSRREARRVEAMALHRGALWVATSQALVSWDFRSPVTTRKHGADAEEGWDELRCLLSTGERLLLGWRTRFEGGAAPAEVFAMAEAPGGVVYAGTGGGDLFVVDGAPSPVRQFASGNHRPVRHVAFADGVLHVAAGGRHHRFDGAFWTSAAPEPTAFSVDRKGRLWLLAEGRLFVVTREGTFPVAQPLERPWCLAVAQDRVWIGGREAVAALPFSG